MLKILSVSFIFVFCIGCSSTHYSSNSSDLYYGDNDNGNSGLEQCEGGCYAEYEICCSINCESDVVLHQEADTFDTNYERCIDRCMRYHQECSDTCLKNKVSL